MLARLDSLKVDWDAWAFDAVAEKRTAQVNDYTLHVKRAGGAAHWKVEHARFGVLIDWTPDQVMAYAKRAAMTGTPNAEKLQQRLTEATGAK